jgi:7-carboxy-7-deazaguanine synthase
MRIAEIFYSVQGEGLLTGVPSVFIRSSGCNLRCTWCDTDYTSWQPEGEDWPIARILEQIARFPSRHAVVTGGEPLLQSDIAELCAELRARGYHITVETAATVFKPLACDLASLSPKLSGSTPRERDGGRWALPHEQSRIQFDVLRAWIERHEYQLKFVIDRRDEVAEVEAILERLPGVERTRVLLMPQAVTREELGQRGPWVAELCKEHGFRYCPRVHIDLFGHRRGT